MSANPDTIAALLTASKLAHQQYRNAQPRIVAGRVVRGDAGHALTALEQAMEARTDAESLDPTHTAPAWEDEPQHEALLTFYRDQLARRH